MCKYCLSVFPESDDVVVVFCDAFDRNYSLRMCIDLTMGRRCNSDLEIPNCRRLKMGPYYQRYLDIPLCEEVYMGWTYDNKLKIPLCRIIHVGYEYDHPLNIPLCEEVILSGYYNHPLYIPFCKRFVGSECYNQVLNLPNCLEYINNYTGDIPDLQDEDLETEFDEIYPVYLPVATSVIINSTIRCEITAPECINLTAPYAEDIFVDHKAVMVHHQLTAIAPGQIIRVGWAAKKIICSQHTFTR